MKMKCKSDNFFKIYNEMQGIGVSVSKLKRKKEVKTHNYTYYIYFLLVCIFLDLCQVFRHIFMDKLLIRI